MARSKKGTRYSDDGPTLNLRKVFIVVAILVLIIIAFINIFSPKKNEEIQTPKKYFSVYESNKWGIIDGEGNWIIQPIYDEMFAIPDNNKEIFIYTYDINEKTGEYKSQAINSKKEKLFKDYDKVEVIENYDSKQNIWYEQNILRVAKGGKYGLIDLQGKQVLPCNYEKIIALKSIKGNFIVQKEGKVGLVNEVGQTIIETKYKDIQTFKEGYKNEYIIIDENGNKGVITTSGNILINPQYKDIKYVGSSDNYAVFDTAWKIVDVSGKKYLETGYEEFKNVKGDNVIVKKDGKFGITSLGGTVKVPNEYQELEYAFSVYYLAKKDDKYGIINVKGENIIPFEYMNMSYIEEGSLIVADKTATETVIFDSNLAQKFTGIVSEINKEKGYIKTYSNNTYKYYNFKFEEKKSSDFLTNSTLFLSKKDGKYGFVNKLGEVVVNYIFEDATEQNEYGYSAVKQNGLWGSINKIGKITLEPSVNLDNSIYTYFIDKWHLSDNGLYFTK